MPDMIFGAFSGPLRECWVNAYDRGGHTWFGAPYGSRQVAARRELTKQRPFARVHVIPKTNPKAQEVFS